MTDRLETVKLDREKAVELYDMITEQINKMAVALEGLPYKEVCGLLSEAEDFKGELQYRIFNDEIMYRCESCEDVILIQEPSVGDDAHICMKCVSQAEDAA